MSKDHQPYGFDSLLSFLPFQSPLQGPRYMGAGSLNEASIKQMLASFKTLGTRDRGKMNCCSLPRYITRIIG